MDPLFDTIDLGHMPYADAYALQSFHLNEVLAARDRGDTRLAGRVLLVEHDPPVITITRRPAAPSHLLASRADLDLAGIEVHETDRGGDITYHGPGQLVVYPILDLNLLKLRLHDYMRLLEAAVIDVCAHFGVPAQRDACATGVWVPQDHLLAPTPVCDRSPTPTAKIAAMGVRIRRWISMHGLAFNVSTNLDHFGLIVPCGLAGRPVTSLRRELGDRAPTIDLVKPVMLEALRHQLRQHLAAPHVSAG